MEKIVRFKIDEKSLFYGCKNDFTKGHTATVSTPINQSSDPEKWHKDILGMIDTEARIDPSTLPEMLIHKCQVNSKSENIRAPISCIIQSIEAQSIGARQADAACARRMQKAARAGMDLSQEDLAKKCGVSRQTISAIEKGDYNPTINLCIAICKVLNKTLDELFWEEERI